MLNDEQWAAVMRAARLRQPRQHGRSAGGHRQVHHAGRIRRGMRRAGQQRHLSRHHGHAVKVLEKDGFEADTVARFLVDEKMQAAATRRPGRRR